jgi:molecular chaperone GrpE
MKKFKEKAKGPEEAVRVQEVELLKNQLVRALADYDNLRKRIEAEKEIWEKVSDSKAALKLLPILDMLYDSQSHLQDSGLAIIVKEFEESLNDLGIEKIEVKVGDKFDPQIEEAIETLVGGEANTIAEVNVIGWKMKNENFVLRPAKVKVFGPDKAQEKEGLAKEAN